MKSPIVMLAIIAKTGGIAHILPECETQVTFTLKKLACS